jgi:hypothetical protein
MTARYASPDESLACLRRAGWSVGETATAGGWLVSGSNGENLIYASGLSQSEAWHRAVEQAKAVGMASHAPSAFPPGLITCRSRCQNIEKEESP